MGKKCKHFQIYWLLCIHYKHRNTLWYAVIYSVCGIFFSLSPVAHVLRTFFSLMFIFVFRSCLVIIIISLCNPNYVEIIILYEKQNTTKKETKWNEILCNFTNSIEKEKVNKVFLCTGSEYSLLIHDDVQLFIIYVYNHCSWQGKFFFLRLEPNSIPFLITVDLYNGSGKKKYLIM